MFKLKSETSKVLGKEVEVFNTKLYLRNLTLGAMKLLEPKLESLNTLASDGKTLSQSIDLVLDVIELLVKRDYEFDRVAVEDTFDMDEIHAFLPKMLEACGLAQKKTD